MLYKGYFGSVTYDDEAGTFFGRVANLQRDGITFEGKSVEELRAAFRESVDDYLAWCAEEGKAQALGESLNDFVTKDIEDEIDVGALA